MSTVKANAIIDASGGNTATINSMTPTADSLQGFRNRIINGDMRIDQRNAGASVTPTNGQYTLDRWYTGVAQTSKLTIQQNAGSVTPPAGFTNYLGITSSSAYSVISTDFFYVQQVIEGFNTADLAWGTANAKTVIISFWVRSSLTGTFSGVLQNYAGNRSYPFTYTISSANTWEQKTVTVAGDTTGTWSTNNSGGVVLLFSVGAGSSRSGTAGAWAGSAFYAATGAVSVVGTNGATFYITGVQLEVGSVATPFERRDYGRELAMCQRYFQKIGFGSSNGVAGIAIRETSNTAGIGFALPVALRSNPTMTVSGANNVWGAGSIITLASSISGMGTNDNQTITNVYFFQTATGIVVSEPYVLYITTGNSYSLSAEL